MPTESDSPTNNSAPELDNPAETDQVFLYPVYFEGADDKATVSTPGEYFELPLPPDLVHLGWPVTDEEGLGLMCNLCGEQGVIRWLKNPRSAAMHMCETHNLSGEGIGVENTRPATEQEAQREGDIDVENMPPVDPTIEHLYFSTEMVTVSGTDQLCLRLATADEIDTDSSSQWQKRKIKSAADPRQNVEKAVRIPAKYTNPNVGGRNPLRPVDSEDQFCLEVDWEIGDVRIWPAWRTRFYQLESEGRNPDIRAPIGIGATASHHNAVTGNDLPRAHDWVDLAANTPHEGQQFEIIPVDGMHPLFYGEAIRQGKSKREVGKEEDYRVNCDSAVFQAVAALHEIDHPTYTTSLHRIRIMWAPGTDKTEYSVLYDAANTQRVRVILPTHGSFHIRGYIDRPPSSYEDFRRRNFGSELVSHVSSIEWISNRENYSVIDGEWFAKYVDLTSKWEHDWYRIFLPAPILGSKSGYRICW